ncbi:MAG: C-type lectin domain-containing protein [Ruminococcus callidus]|nr:C-type lectin domain-containing protein [Ruminococcus callidus]
MRNRKFLLFPALFAVAITLTACDGTVNLTGSVPYTEGENKTLENTSEEVSETENSTENETEETTSSVDTSKIPEYAVTLNGHSYYIYNGDWENIDSYSDAEKYCEEQGGYMADISSDEENDFLFKYVQDEGYTSAYFGFKYDLDSNKWVNSHDSSETYKNWGVDQPDGTGENFYAKFGSAAADGTWANDSFGKASEESNVKMFLCEWDGVRDGADSNSSSEESSAEESESEETTKEAE